MPFPERLPQGPHLGIGIDAQVTVEPLVLEPDEHLYKFGIHVAGRNAHPPAAIGHGISAQQAAIAGQHLCPDFAGKGRQERRIDPTVEAATPQRPDEQDTHQREYGKAAHSFTGTRPGSVRAQNCGRYMSSTLAAGW